jgi:short-subunit dehydrogenase
MALTLQDAVRGRTVMITGASSGIGKEAALKVGAADCTLLLVARRRELLEEAKAEIEARGGVAHLYVCDSPTRMTSTRWPQRFWTSTAVSTCS